MNADVYQDFDMQSLAWWLMDGATRSNPSGGIRLTIGKQPHYSLTGAFMVSQIIKERTGLEGQVVECDDCYRITFTEGLEDLIPFFHPNVAYKITYSLWDSRIGEQWPAEVISNSRKIFMEVDHPGGTPSCLEEDITFLVSRTRARGFPFISLPPSQQKQLWRDIQEESKVEIGEDGSLYTKSTYNNLSSMFFPNRYAVSSGGRKTPLQVYCNKSLLRESLSKQVASGGKRESSNIRNAISFYIGAKAAAQFNPLWARHFIQELLPGGGTVLDTCAGWGGRLLGAVSTGCSYYGIDPEPRTVQGLKEISSFLGEEGAKGSCTIIEGKAEDPLSYLRLSSKADMLLTCPPYYDHEKYSLNKNQSIKRYTTYKTWLSGFMLKILENSYAHLKDGAPAVVVVGDVLKTPLVTDTLEAALRVGFILDKMVSIRVGVTGYCEKALVLHKGGSL